MKDIAGVTWKIVGPARRSTSWTGRKFASFQGVGTVSDGGPPVELHRTVTVIMRHDRYGRELATGKEVRALALRALIRAGAQEVHQTVDPDNEEQL